MIRGVTRFLMVLVGAWCLCCCTSKPELTDEERAAAVAKSCYEALYNGHPELFLDGRIDAQEMPRSYRDQLLKAYRLHASQVDSQHRGIKGISISRAEKDSVLNVLTVFMVLDYGDATKEEMVVPMVEREGKWLMK